MKKSDIDNILESNNQENINFYFSQLISKTKDIDSENNRLSLFMLLLILFYYLTDFAAIDSINVGPLSIGNIESVKIFIPLIFSFLIFRFVIINSHRAELKKIIRKFSYKHFKFDNQNLDIVFVDDFSRTLMPVSIYDELNKFNAKSKAGCLNSILMIPLVAIPAIAISIAPFIFEFFWLKPMINDFMNLGILKKVIIILTIWMLILSVVYFFKTAVLGVRED